MKKIIILTCILMIVSAAFLGACGSASEPTSTTEAVSGNETETSITESSVPELEDPLLPSVPEPTTIRLGGMTGATTMGMAKLLEDAKAGVAFNEYEFTLAGSADEITPRLVSGELDIAAVPANLASVLYNNTDGKVKLLAINTLGVLYLVENGDTIQSFADLQGKTIYATGRGSVPEYVLRYLLVENGLDPDKDVTIEWKTEPAEVVALLSNNSGNIAMLPQPYATVAQGKLPNLRLALDLSQEWDVLGNGSMLVTAVLVVRSEFAEEYEAQIAEFLREYQASTEYANTNVPEAAKLIGELGIVDAAIAEKALPYCNIVYLTGSEMQEAIEGYLQVLYEQNPKSVGGALPDEEFYWWPK